MIERYFGGAIPEASSGHAKGNYLSGTADFATDALTRIIAHYDRLNFSLALEEIWELIAAIDKYITVEKPWTLADKPEDRERLGRVLYTAAEGLRCVAALAHPVLPEATQKIWRQLGLENTSPLASLNLDLLAWGQLAPGTKIGKPEGIFPRLDKAQTIERIENMEQEQNNPLAQPAAAPAATPAAASAATPAVVPAATRPPPPLRRRSRARRKLASRILPRSKCAWAW